MSKSQPRRRCAVILLLLASVAQSTPYILPASRPSQHVPSAGAGVQKKRGKIFSAASAARAMNSETFLRELCASKNTADIVYYVTHDEPKERRNSGEDEAEIMQRTSKLPQFLRNCRDIGATKSLTNEEDVPSPPLSCKNTVEYTGKLWFLPKSKGMKFRETISVSDISPDGQSAKVRCDTETHDGKQWVDCSRVICRFDSSDGGGDDDEVVMNVDSEVLMRLPLPGIAGRAVRKKIGSVFQNAAESFFERISVRDDWDVAVREDAANALSSPVVVTP